MLAGWVHRRRDHGHLTFLDLRDRYGITQVVTNADEAADAHAAAEPARNEWVVQVSGAVRHRPPGTANADLATGEVEVAVDAFTVLNPSKVPPFYVNEEQPGLDESLRLTHRYLDLRRPPLQARMLLRSRLASATRRQLEGLGFVSLSPGEDQRDRVVALTKGGRTRLHAAAAAWSKVQESLSSALGADAERLVALARRVTDLARNPEAR